MRVGTLFVCLVLVAACGKSEKDGGDKSSSGKRDRPTNTDVASLFTGATVTLPVEVAKASFDDKKDAVLKAVGADSTYLTSKTHADVSYDFRFSKSDNLEEISISARKTPLDAILTKQWGPPIKTDKGDMFWFSPEGLRATVGAKSTERASFKRYESIPTLLGPAGFELAFAKGKPLFGATLDELHAAWGAKLCDYDREAPRIKEAFAKNAADGLYRLQDARASLLLCPAWPRTVEPYSPQADRLHIGLDGKVYSFHMSFPLGGSEELKAKLVKELDAKFGTPIEVTSEKQVDRFYFDPASKMRAIVSTGDPNYLGLTVGPYLPIAELIGDDKTNGLAIETPSMIGGTFEQIAKENEAHIRKHGTFLSSVYPPTEWARHQTEIDYHHYDKQTKTYEYRVVVHHTGHEKGGDELFELLKKKYGEPKATKGDDKDRTYSFAKGDRKLAARRVSQQWQLAFTK